MNFHNHPVPVEDLTRKVRRYQRLKALLPTLEAEIKTEAALIYRAEGYLANPRIERIIERFA